MIQLNTLQELFYKQLREDNEQQRRGHKKSGKLSAGQLGMPAQWQILNALKVEGSEIEDYTLGKFKRGNDVEDMLITTLKSIVIDKQVECEYMDTVGKLDILADGKPFSNQHRKIKQLPIEVKSVTNADFKWITKRNQAKPQHKLQAGFYALALGLPYYSIAYIASDDYRMTLFIGKTDSIEEAIDEKIYTFQQYWQAQQIPVFQADQKWMENPKYNNYPEWMYKSEEELFTLSNKYFSESEVK